MTNGLYETKRPMTLLAGRYGHPLHPMLVTVPIGAWTASVVFDVASHLVKVPGFLVQGAEWLIAVGIVGALAAAGAGILDFYVIPAGTRVYRTVALHMSLNLVVITAFGANFVWRYGGLHKPGPVPAAQLAASAASLVFLAVSGYLGGKLTYRYGVRVADEQTQARGFADRRGEPDRPLLASPVPASYPAVASAPAPAASAGPAAALGYYERPAPAWPSYSRTTGPAPGSRAETYWRRDLLPPYEESAS
jgi:uncharacterized membrane protein